MQAKEKDKAIMKIDNGTEDIQADWKDVLDKWFRMMEKTKTPKKSKGKSFCFRFLLTMKHIIVYE